MFFVYKIHVAFDFIAFIITSSVQTGFIDMRCALRLIDKLGPLPFIFTGRFIGQIPIFTPAFRPEPPFLMSTFHGKTRAEQPVGMSTIPSEMNQGR